MEYIIVGGIIIIIILLIILIVRSVGESNITERIGKLENSTTKELGNFKFDMIKEINSEFDNVNERIENKLNMINDKVNERIDDNFNKSNKTFNNVLERLSRIDEAQKKIDGLSGDIVNLQSILTDKKSRGIFGEINLKHIMYSIFGDNDRIYKMQYSFDNERIVDCALFAPLPLGTIGIDSKFPMESYRNMVDTSLSKLDRSIAAKQFKVDVKKHIDAISSKYIIPGITSSQAIMFLPAEAIFAEINAYHSDIVEYANKKRVWITSPTTLMATLTVIQVIIKNIERDKYANVIHEELNKLGIEFSRYKERWDKLSRSIETVNKDVESIHITTDKISKRFESISNANVDKIE